MNGGEAVVETLRLAGVTHVFGLLGSSMMEVYDALYDCKDIAYVGVRDERSGTHMADAFGRVSGRPGVVLAGQAGPGAANLLTGLIQAKLVYSPLLALTGLASNDHLGPRDLFAENIEVEQPGWDARSAISGTVLDARSIEAIKTLLLGAKRPVIVVGGGVKSGRGWDAVVGLARTLALPIAASAGHADVVPNDYPLIAGQVGPRGNPAASRLTREADVILALGTRLGFNTTFYTYNDIAKGAQIVQVDADPLALGRHFPIEIGVAGDAGSVAAAMAEALDGFEPNNAPWRARNEAFLREREEVWRERERAARETTMPLKPARVFAELREVMPKDAIVTLDAGTLCLQSTDQLRYFTPPALITPLDFGLVGFSYAAGLGAKAAAPERPVITLMGDGGFAMTMAEITTAVTHELLTVAVVLDNGCWGAEKAYQRDFYNGRYIGSDVMSPPYDAVAGLCGAQGYRASKPGEVAEALSDALAKRTPAVIHVKVDPDAIVSFRRDSFKHRGGGT